MSNLSLKSVLVVDDHPMNRLIPGLILRPFGWVVYESNGGLDALRILRTTPVVCVLLDISMPDVSGLDVLRVVRADSSLSNLKMIAYTGYMAEEDTSYLINIGFDAVLTKPLTSEKLIKIIGF